MTTLIFCAGAAEPDLSVLAHTSCDLLVGVDGGAARLAAAGFLPDCAVGDFDSAAPPPCGEILRLPAEKDDTDLEAALAHILPRYAPENVREIIILGALGAGRPDHLLANVWLAHQPRFALWLDKIRFVETCGSLAFYRAGRHCVRRETGRDYLSFIGLTPLRALTLEGVKYPLAERDFAYPCALVSNEFLGGEMFFSLADGLVGVVQSADAPQKAA